MTQSEKDIEEGGTWLRLCPSCGLVSVFLRTTFGCMCCGCSYEEKM